MELTAEQNDLLTAVLGTRISKLSSQLDERSRMVILALYREGIVTFALPCGNLCRLDPVGAMQTNLIHAEA